MRKRVGLVLLFSLVFLLFYNCAHIRMTSERKKLSLCKQNLRNLGLASECYAVDHNGRYTPRLEALIEEGYLGWLPKDPKSNEKYILDVDNERGNFQICAPEPEKYYYAPDKRCSKICYISERGLVVYDENGKPVQD